MSDLLEQIEHEMKAATPGPWYANENDLIGGYCLMTVDAPLSEAHTSSLADFVREEDTRFIAHAAAYIEAMLPVVKAALALEETSDTWGQTHAIAKLFAAVRAFKEAKRETA